MKRLVVKVGSSTVITPEGTLDRPYIEALTRALCEQQAAGLEVALVSSGAIGTGAARLGIPRPTAIPQKQAAAAVGQSILMGVYASCFGEHGAAAGQLLLSRGDVADRTRYTNICNTFDALFRLGVIPVINENDTVAIEEIRFGDNDELAALVALVTDADLVVILSDVPGLYDPSDETHRTIGTIPAITPEVEAMARPTEGKLGTGGMVTKMRAARIVTRSGIPMVIGHGRDPGVIAGAVARWQARQDGRIDPESPGTLFMPHDQRLQGRKRWLAFGGKARGALVVNERAGAALVEEGRSLLAAGVVEVSGRFAAGDMVRILDRQGGEIARGLVNYSLEEMKLIQGRRSHEFKELVGRDDLQEVIHRDNLVLDA